MKSNNVSIHHIGYLVKNVFEAVDTFLDMGYEKESDIVYDKFRDIDICFLLKEGYRVELVAPKSKESVVGKLYKKIGNAPYHICYEVCDLEQSIEEYIGKGFIIWDEPNIAPALDNHHVVFLMERHMGIVELLEKG